MEDLTGKQFGHYQIVAPLGEGGMAAVYKAYQPSMERFVAVKVLPRHMAASEEFVSRFRREAKMLAQLQHPHILPVFDYGEAEGYPYIVMPFVQSGTLAELIQKRRLPFSETRRIMVQIGDALAYAHARGMIHRDIKPSNVLIDERGNCLLTDFGLARMAESATKITTSGTVMGTPAYMSPEQGAGAEIDHRTDIYSLGIIFYEMVTGRVPFQAETPIAIVFKHIQDPLPSARKYNPDLPEAVELVLLKTLSKTPDDRYQKAEDFVQAIQKAIPESISVEESPSQTSLPAAPTIIAQSAKTNEKTTYAEPQVANAQAVKASIPEVSASKVVVAKSPKTRRLPVWALGGLGALALVIIGAIVVIGGMRKNSTPPPNPTSPVVNTSIPPNTPEPSPTSPPTIEISPGMAFRDEFEGQLAEGWTWMAEDPSRWSLTEVPGSLQIIASDASINGPALPSNILLRNAPAGDFEITTSLRFKPTSNFQFAGLVVFQDDGNVLQFGRAFCNIGNSCAGDGVYFDNYENDTLIGGNFSTAYKGPGIYLRLQRIGNIYRGSISEDGQRWLTVGEHARDFSQARVGLMTAQAPMEIPAVFDYFTSNVSATATTRTDTPCRAMPDGQADVVFNLQPNMTFPVRGVSLDNQWLNVQHPERTEATCWISFNSSISGERSIHSGYECTDPLGCAQIARDAPFHVAFWGVLSGSNVTLGQDALRGVEIAIDDLGGSLFGHDILLTKQDALCTKDGGAAAAEQLVSDPTILALIGSTCSDETLGGIATVTEASLTTISPSNTRPSLTEENRGPEFAGYLRTAPNDAIQGKVVAEFTYNVLGIRRVATIHDETAYSTALQQVFAEEFTQLGGQIVAQESVSSNAVDMRGVLTQISGNNPEAIYYPVLVAAGGAITAQVREIPGLENVKLISSDTNFNPDFLAMAGPSSQGMFISSPDFNRFPGIYGSFVDKYLAKYGTPPISVFHAHAYDAANMIFVALMKTAVVDGNGMVYVPRQALRDAIYTTRDFMGITGILTCTPSGDCGAPVVGVYEVTNSDPATWNPQDPANPNPGKIYP